MSPLTPSVHLYNNLILINKFVPGSRQFVTCVKEGMFAQPNRQGFEVVMHYLLNAYDPVRCAAQITWPLLDHKQTRLFHRSVVAYVKEISVEIPEAKLPPFSPSFLTSPGGDRFIKFMWKLSMIVLKTVMERYSEPGDDPVLQFPRCSNRLLLNLARADIEEVKHMVDQYSQFLIDACRKSKELVKAIFESADELKAAQAELFDRVQNASLNNADKSAFLKTDVNVSPTVVNRWLSHLKSEFGGTVVLHNEFKKFCDIVQDCYNSVKQLSDSHAKPTVLDASTLYPSSKAPIKLSDMMLEASYSVQELSQLMLESGGLQPLDQVAQSLTDVSCQLGNLKSDLTSTWTGYIELMSKVMASNCEHRQHLEETSVQSVRFKDEYQLLQDAKLETPKIAIKFESQSVPNCILSTDSPPVGSVIDVRRAQRRKDGVSGTCRPITPSGLHPPLHTNGWNSVRRTRIPTTPASSGVPTHSARTNMSSLRIPTMTSSTLKSVKYSSPTLRVPTMTPFNQKSVKSSTPFLALRTPAKPLMKLSEAKPVKKSTYNGIRTPEQRCATLAGNCFSQPKAVKNTDVLPVSSVLYTQSSIFKESKSRMERNSCALPGENSADAQVVNPCQLSLCSETCEEDNTDLKAQGMLDLATENSPSSKTCNGSTAWQLSPATGSFKEAELHAQKSLTFSPRRDLGENVSETPSPGAHSDKEMNKPATTKRRDSLLKAVLSRSPSGSPGSPIRVRSPRKSLPQASPALVLGWPPIKTAISCDSNHIQIEAHSALSKVKNQIVLSPQITVPKESVVIVVSAPSEFDSPVASLPSCSFDKLGEDLNGSLLTSMDEEFVSPSGRLSWKPEPVEAQEIREETIKEKEVQRVDEKEADETQVETDIVKNVSESKPVDGERRKSLLGVIQRFYQLVGTRSEREKQPKPEPSPEPLDLDLGVDVDLDLDLDLSETVT